MTLHFAICFQCQFQHHGKIFFFLLAVTVMANLLTFTNMTPIVLNQGWHKQGNPPQSWSQQLHLYCLLTVNRFVILNWNITAYHHHYVCLLFFFCFFFFLFGARQIVAESCQEWTNGRTAIRQPNNQLKLIAKDNYLYVHSITRYPFTLFACCHWKHWFLNTIRHSVSVCF